MKTFHLFRVAVPAVILMAGWSHVAVSGQVNGAASASASASASGGAQHPNASGAVNANGAAGANGSGASANAKGSASGGAPVPVSQMQAELATKVDSKTAKAGDAVEAKTTKTVTMTDGTVIPKGSKLMGSVTAVQAHEKGQADSTLGLSFDRVRLRGGQEVLLRSSIDNVSSPVGMSAEGDMGMDDMIGAGPMAASGGGVARGGLGAGGVVGGVAGGATSSVARTGNALGSTTQSTGNLARGTTQGVGSTVNGAASGASGFVSGTTQASAGVVAHSTNVPGVMLSGSAMEGTSGVLSAAGKNVHLDSGTQMMLSVAAQK